jgi:hypothetical protein
VSCNSLLERGALMTHLWITHTGSMKAGRRDVERRCRISVLFLVVGVAAASVSTVAAQQLTLGSVALKLGETDSAVTQDLSKRYRVERIDGGWSIQPLKRSDTVPGIGVRTVDGRIEGVTFIWGPGFTPAAEEVAEQLAQALPAGAHCEMNNVTRHQEGGTVRTLEWLCGTYKVGFVTGVWPQGGNTTTISIHKY